MNRIPKKVKLKPIDERPRVVKALDEKINKLFDFDGKKALNGLKIGLLVTGALAGGVAAGVILGPIYLPQPPQNVVCQCEQPEPVCNCECYCGSEPGPESNTEPSPESEPAGTQTEQTPENPEKARRLVLVSAELEQITVTSEELELAPSASGEVIGFYLTSMSKLGLDLSNTISQGLNFLVSSLLNQEAEINMDIEPKYDIVIMDRNGQRTLKRDLEIGQVDLEALITRISESGNLAEIFKIMPWPVAVSPDGQSVVYPQGEDLMLSRTDGSGEEKIGDYSGGHISSLSWSPDGQKILYEQNNEVVAFDLSTRETSRIPEGHDPSWLPDMSGIIYTKVIGGEYHVAIRNLETNEDVITRIVGKRPAVSPDGSRIAYLVPKEENQYVAAMRDTGSGRWVELIPAMEQSLEWSPDNVLALTYYTQGDNGVVPHIALFNRTAEILKGIPLKENSLVTNVSWADSNHIYLDMITVPIPEMPENPDDINWVEMILSMMGDGAKSDLYRLNLEFGYEEIP